MPIPWILSYMMIMIPKALGSYSFISFYIYLFIFISYSFISLICGFTIYIAKVVQLIDNKVYFMLL